MAVAKSHSAKQHTPSILIIDDQSAVHDVLTGILDGAGFESESLHRGDEALERYKSKRFDLVLTDLTMQPMDGLTLLSEIKKFDPQARVVVMTGRDSEIDMQKARDLGAEACVQKPFRITDLVDLLAKVFRRDSS